MFTFVLTIPPSPPPHFFPARTRTLVRFVLECLFVLYASQLVYTYLIKLGRRQRNTPVRCQLWAAGEIAAEGERRPCVCARLSLLSAPDETHSEGVGWCERAEPADVACLSGRQEPAGRGALSLSLSLSFSLSQGGEG